MHIEEGNALFSTFAVSPFEHKDEEKPEKARNGTHNFNPEERRRTDNHYMVMNTRTCLLASH